MRDVEIVASIVAGDPNGLAEAYDRYADLLFRYCRTLLGDWADAADAVQDTFITAASRAGGLREPERLRSWLYAVARNECLRILRTKKGTSALDEAPDVSDDSADVGDRVERTELRALFEAATDGLNPGEREVIELQLRQGLEAGEVAAVLGVSRNHAHSLLSRARAQLEACLGVLLVGRAGSDECDELGALLTGWDGRLTVLLRKRVHRHIEQCGTCTARRAFELSPAALLDLSPGAALAAGAAESLRLAFGTPQALRSHTLALATGRGPVAVAHSSAVLARAGAFGKHGFPKPAHAGHAGLAGQHPVAGKGPAGLRALRTSSRGQAAAAAAVVIAIAATAFALAGNTEHITPSADPKPSPSVPQATPASTRPSASPSAKLAARRPAPSASASVAPTGARTSTGATRMNVGSSPAGSTPGPSASTGSRSATSTPSPTSTTSPPTPPGVLSVAPDGGTLLVVPGSDGATVSLAAAGGLVTWSAVVANDPGQVVSVSPASGTVTPGDSGVTLQISVSRFVRCGLVSGKPCPTVTISPGGATFTVWTGLDLPDLAGLVPSSGG